MYLTEKRIQSPKEIFRRRWTTFPLQNTIVMVRNTNTPKNVHRFQQKSFCWIPIDEFHRAIHKLQHAHRSLVHALIPRNGEVGACILHHSSATHTTSRRCWGSGRVKLSIRHQGPALSSYPHIKPFFCRQNATAPGCSPWSGIQPGARRWEINPSPHKNSRRPYQYRPATQRESPQLGPSLASQNALLLPHRLPAVLH